MLQNVLGLTSLKKQTNAWNTLESHANKKNQTYTSDLMVAKMKDTMTNLSLHYSCCDERHLLTYYILWLASMFTLGVIARIFVIPSKAENALLLFVMDFFCVYVLGFLAGVAVSKSQSATYVTSTQSAAVTIHDENNSINRNDTTEKDLEQQQHGGVRGKKNFLINE